MSTYVASDQAVTSVAAGTRAVLTLVLTVAAGRRFPSKTAATDYTQSYKYSSLQVVDCSAPSIQSILYFNTYQTPEPNNNRHRNNLLDLVSDSKILQHVNSCC